MLKHILLYGNSVPLTGLAVQLQSQADLEVQCQTPGAGLVKLGNLDAVIVDFDDISAGDVLDIVRARPNLKIVGINPPNNAIFILSGEVYLAHTLNDVVTCLRSFEA